jgi:Spy/CpxP family protein refolding chaperone
MTSSRKRRILPRVLAGTVIAASLAFAAPAEAQQSGGQASGQRPERGAEQRGPGRRGERPDPAQMIDRRVTMLTERLDLSATQGVSIREILLDEQTKMRALRPELGSGQPGQRPAGSVRGERTRGDSAGRAQRSRPDSAERAQLRMEFQALRQSTDARIEGVLTVEQRTAYRELVKARGERLEGGPRRGGAGRGTGQGGADRGGQRTPPPVVS